MIDDTCSCPCGASTFAVKGEPFFRGYCHCKICQEFNKAPFADITVFRASDITEPEDLPIEYKVYKKGGVDRGACSKCGSPSLEYFDGPGLPKLAIVPSARFAHQDKLPKSEMHIWYENRVEDVNDDIPKYEGVFRSQGKFILLLFKRLIFS